MGEFAIPAGYSGSFKASGGSNVWTGEENKEVFKGHTDISLNISPVTTMVKGFMDDGDSVEDAKTATVNLVKACGVNLEKEDLFGVSASKRLSQNDDVSSTLFAAFNAVNNLQKSLVAAVRADVENEGIEEGLEAIRTKTMQKLRISVKSKGAEMSIDEVIEESLEASKEFVGRSIESSRKRIVSQEIQLRVQKIVDADMQVEGEGEIPTLLKRISDIEDEAREGFSDAIIEEAIVIAKEEGMSEEQFEKLLEKMQDEERESYIVKQAEKEAVSYENSILMYKAEKEAVEAEREAKKKAEEEAKKKAEEEAREKAAEEAKKKEQEGPFQPVDGKLNLIALAKAKGSLEENETKREEVETELTAKQDELTATKDDVEHGEADLDAKETELAMSESDLRDLNDQKVDIEDSIDMKTQELAQRQEKKAKMIQHMEEDLTPDTPEFLEMETKLAQLEDMIKEDSKELHESQKSLAETIKSIVEYDESISKSKAEIDELKDSISSSKESIVTLEDEISQLDEENAELQEKISSLKEEIKELESGVELPAPEPVPAFLEVTPQHNGELDVEDLLIILNQYEGQRKEISEYVDNGGVFLPIADASLKTLEGQIKDIKSLIEKAEEEAKKAEEEAKKAEEEAKKKAEEDAKKAEEEAKKKAEEEARKEAIQKAETEVKEAQAASDKANKEYDSVSKTLEKVEAELKAAKEAYDADPSEDNKEWVSQAEAEVATVRDMHKQAAVEGEEAAKALKEAEAELDSIKEEGEVEEPIDAPVEEPKSEGEIKREFWLTFEGSIGLGPDPFQMFISYVNGRKGLENLVREYGPMINFYNHVREGVAAGGDFDTYHSMLEEAMNWDPNAPGLSQYLASAMNDNNTFAGRPGDNYNTASMPAIWSGSMAANYEQVHAELNETIKAIKAEGSYVDIVYTPLQAKVKK